MPEPLSPSQAAGREGGPVCQWRALTRIVSIVTCLKKRRHPPDRLVAAAGAETRPPGPSPSAAAAPLAAWPGAQVPAWPGVTVAMTVTGTAWYKLETASEPGRPAGLNHWHRRSAAGKIVSQQTGVLLLQSPTQHGHGHSHSHGPPC